MILKKEFPEPNELVIAVVKKIMPYGAYCYLKDYDLDAYLPIKEVASGWTKNIREFLKEGQTSVAKVIFIDKDKRAIDISLKKVSSKESRDKISEDNLENRARNLFDNAIAQSKTEDKREEIKKQLATKFTNYSDIVDAVLAGENVLEDLDVSNDFKEALIDVVHKNIKPKVYTVSYVTEISSQGAGSGVEEIKKTLEEVEGIGVKVQYLGAPRYKLTASGDSYPEAEAKIKKAYEILSKHTPKVVISLEKEN